MADAGAGDDESDHVMRDEYRGNRRHAPRDERDDQHPTQRFEVLDHRHALLLDRRTGLPAALWAPRPSAPPARHLEDPLAHGKPLGLPRARGHGSKPVVGGGPAWSPPVRLLNKELASVDSTPGYPRHADGAPLPRGGLR